MALGGALLLLAAHLPAGHATAPPGESDVMLHELVDPGELVDAPQPSVPRRVSQTSKTAAAPSETASRTTATKDASKLREVAPAEALPATKGKALSSQPLTGSTARSVASDAPFSVAIVPEDASLEALAATLADRLAQAGLAAKRGTLDSAGRPDALVVLATGATTPSVWYCDPGSDASPLLALAMEQALPGSDSLSDGPAVPFACDQVHDGRARTAAILVELPPGAATLAASSELLSDGVRRYFAQNAATVRRDRAAPRLSWPATGPITSYYGPAHPLGIDIGQSAGDILAATAGTVVFAGGDPCCSYGLYVVIDSPEGVRTVYGHLSSLRVKTGDRVRQGQALGVVGCTGHCDGNHLHFEVIDNGIRVDPLRYLP